MYRLLFISFLVWISVICNAQDTLNSKSIVFSYSQTYIGKDIRLGISKSIKKDKYLSFGIKCYLNDLYDFKGSLVNSGGYGEKRYKALNPEHRGGIFFNYGKVFHKKESYNLSWELRNQVSYLKTDYYWNEWYTRRNALLVENNFGISMKVNITDNISLTEYIGGGISTAKTFKPYEQFFGQSYIYRPILFKFNYQLSAAIEYKF